VTIEKPISQASINNREPIFAQLQRLLKNTTSVLEIGSGTGQHAVYFAGELPHLHWHTSDLAVNHPGINQWLDEYSGDNISRPFEFDVTGDWPELKVDALYTANTLHIMGFESVKQFFAGLANVLNNNGKLIVYGPFKYNGEFTTPSNANFDIWLKNQNPVSGIRDIEVIQELAKEQGLELVEDNAMPANNQLLVFEKK
jgi:cyclopropane fatty-acyl-phospholipid synthase-like methyltransferase